MTTAKLRKEAMYIAEQLTAMTFHAEVQFKKELQLLDRTLYNGVFSKEGNVIVVTGKADKAGNIATLRLHTDDDKGIWSATLQSGSEKTDFFLRLGCCTSIKKV